jgi:hypothetical protein
VSVPVATKIQPLVNSTALALLAKMVTFCSYMREKALAAFLHWPAFSDRA